MQVAQPPQGARAAPVAAAAGVDGIAGLAEGMSVFERFAAAAGQCASAHLPPPASRLSPRLRVMLRRCVRQGPPTCWSHAGADQRLSDSEMRRFATCELRHLPPRCIAALCPG